MDVDLEVDEKCDMVDDAETADDEEVLLVRDAMKADKATRWSSRWATRWRWRL